VIADYDAETALQRELVLRLASILWRLRRTTSIVSAGNKSSCSTANSLDSGFDVGAHLVPVSMGK
jgi:hypothetical protein